MVARNGLKRKREWIFLRRRTRDKVFGWWENERKEMKKWVVAMEIRKTTATLKKNETIYRSLMDWALKKMDQGFKKNMLG